MFHIILKEMRINHYIKNLVVFIPILYNNIKLNTINISNTILLFLSFCFIASAVYVINDLKDKNEDKKNLYNAQRPIAQNLISLKQAYTLTIICIILASLFSIYTKTEFFIFTYLLLNILYTFCLRNIFYIDVCCIAFGFILRILAGYTIIQTIPNKDLLYWIFFTSSIFTFTKRRLELQSNKSNKRKVLKNITLKQIKIYTYINTLFSILFFIKLSSILNTQKFYIISLTYTFFIIKLIKLSNKKNEFHDPINFIKKDIIFKVLLLLLIVEYILFYIE